MKRLAMCILNGVLWIAMLCWHGSASAHKPSDSYLTLHAHGDGVIDVDWHIALRDLDTELHLDNDDDGRLTWGEVRPRWAELKAYAHSHLTLRQAGQGCMAIDGSVPAPQIDTHSDGRYAVLRWTLRCFTTSHDGDVNVRIDYRLFALTDPTHRGILHLISPDGSSAAGIVGTSRPVLSWTFSGGAAATTRAAHTSPWQTFIRFVADGARHIASGADHILFLLSLLLVSAWQRGRGTSWWPAMAGWQPRTDWRASLMEVLRLVTAFTVAHSITLGLAALNLVAPPPRWVEPLIAFSVLLAALDNLWPVLRVPRWLVVFGFGLVHGFGFAGALQDLGLARGEMAVPLVGFNLGVELGQLSLVAVAWPLICLGRRAAVYRWVAVGGGSIAIALIALVWLVERTTGGWPMLPSA